MKVTLWITTREAAQSSTIVRTMFTSGHQRLRRLDSPTSQPRSVSLRAELDSNAVKFGPNEADGQRGRGHRYIGRSSKASRFSQVPSGNRPIGLAATSGPRPKGVNVQLEDVKTVSVPRAAWSARLGFSLISVLIIGATFRVWGLFAPPLDPSGVEATHAAAVQSITQAVPGMIFTEALRPLLVQPPWEGPLPANPNSAFPLFSWIAAAVSAPTGELWPGRLVAVFFSILAGLLLFGLVRHVSGARAALYALLMYSVSPLSLLLGQHFSPASLVLSAQALALLTVVSWRFSINSNPYGSVKWLLLTIAAGFGSALLEIGSLFLLIPVAYVMLTPSLAAAVPDTKATRRSAAAHRGKVSTWRDVWATSPHSGKVIAYAAALFSGALSWWLYAGPAQGSSNPTDGQDVLATVLGSGTYVQIVGLTIERVLTLFGLLLLIAGLLRGGRQPLRFIFHVWFASALLNVLLAGGRLGRQEDVLLPLILPAVALVGTGAAWVSSFPARVWLALTEQRRDADDAYVVSPHTAWLLDIPEQLASPDGRPRPQARLALGRSVAARSQQAGDVLRRLWFGGIGHIGILAGFALIVVGQLDNLGERLSPTESQQKLLAIGREVQSATSPGVRLIVAGPDAPQLFYATERRGWSMPEEQFSLAAVEALQRQGAGYLLSTDQEWLGKQPDYRGLLTNYTVRTLANSHILFDLNVKPAADDRLYFLESGHTLGGDFRRFWEQNGGVAKFGYPISEEMRHANPVDGVVRTVQYFERAVLESHPEFAGTGDAVMLASVGRWVTAGKVLPRVAPFPNTEDRAYFPDTGHGVKESFLRFWQREGGVALFGYPISEEMPEISASDGKVYTVQYFERARLEWHPTFEGTGKEVQLGLIGKQALEMRP